MQRGWTGKYPRHPSPVAVHVACIAGAANGSGASITQPNFVTQPQRSRRDVAFCQHPQKMDRHESSAKTNHFGPANCCLQPQSVMESSIPIVDRSMVAAK